MSALIRVGHRGADALAPGNTLASFEAAVAVGVDAIEFDVLSERRDGGGELFVVHDRRALRRARPLTLGAALAHFAGPAYGAIRLQVDVKLAGFERRLVDALRDHDLLARSFISSGVTRALASIRALEPTLALGWTVPELPGVAESTLIAATVARPYVNALPRRAVARITDGRVDMVVAHWRVVGAKLVDAVLGAGGEIYVWTVDDRAELARLRALGVTGVITNDPRLFAPAAP